MSIHNEVFMYSLTTKLNQNESILWVGQPDRIAYQKKFARVMLLISAATSLVLGSWLLYMMSYTKVLWCVWLIPVTLMFYGVVRYEKIAREGDAWERQFYAITNQRIVTSRFEEMTFIYGSIDLEDIWENRITKYDNSVGTITLISKETFVTTHITIECINNAEVVHKMIDDLVKRGLVDCLE